MTRKPILILPSALLGGLSLLPPAAAGAQTQITTGVIQGTVVDVSA